MSFDIPRRVRENAAKTAERGEWLRRLPATVSELIGRWKLTVDPPFDSDEVSAAWVAPARRRNGEPVVLKLGMPHMEAEQEIVGLRFWAGDPFVRLLDADDTLGAMLLERCEPGMPLRGRPADEQDGVIASLLRRMWRKPPTTPAFRPLASLVDFWSAETRSQSDRWPDSDLVEYGLRLMSELSRATSNDVLLGTDVHAGNVLSAEREPWLVIDPKPFVGDPAFDATQHLINCAERVIADPRETSERFADLLEVDADRVRAWLFARAASEPRDDWNERSLRLARATRM